MILEEETYKEYGYSPSNLSHGSNKQIICACDECGKIRKIQLYQYRSLCKSCSKKGTRNGKWKGGLITIKCEVCGKEKKVRKDRLEIGWGRFCSQKCKRKKLRMPTHHTKPELIFEQICKNNNLDFHYVGDGSLWIGKKEEKQLNPDFIEANGKKICVEIMGAYWHSPLLNPKIKKNRILTIRENHYKKYKWQSIFIWDTDLFRKDAEKYVLNELGKV